MKSVMGAYAHIIKHACGCLHGDVAFEACANECFFLSSVCDNQLDATMQLKSLRAQLDGAHKALKAQSVQWHWHAGVTSTNSMQAPAMTLCKCADLIFLLMPAIGNQSSRLLTTCCDTSACMRLGLNSQHSLVMI